MCETRNVNILQKFYRQNLYLLYNQQRYLLPTYSLLPNTHTHNLPFYALETPLPRQDIDLTPPSVCLNMYTILTHLDLCMCVFTHVYFDPLRPTT